MSDHMFNKIDSQIEAGLCERERLLNELDSQSQLIKEKDARIEDYKLNYVTTAYHDSVVAEAVKEIARLKEALESTLHNWEENKDCDQCANNAGIRAELVLTKREVFGMKIVVDRDITNDRVEFRNDKGELVGVIENIEITKVD